MAHSNDGSHRLAKIAFVCGLLGFPLWLLSFSWVPFALMGRSIGAVWYIILASEVSALLAALSGVGLGLIARRRAHVGTANHQLASRGLVIGVIVLVLVVGLNIIGLVLDS